MRYGWGFGGGLGDGFVGRSWEGYYMVLWGDVIDYNGLGL